MYSVDLYGRVRRACHVEGMPIREAARVFGLHRETVSKMLRYSAPPGYRRSGPVRRPKLGLNEHELVVFKIFLPAGLV